MVYAVERPCCRESLSLIHRRHILWRATSPLPSIVLPGAAPAVEGGNDFDFALSPGGYHLSRGHDAAGRGCLLGVKYQHDPVENGLPPPPPPSPSSPKFPPPSFSSPPYLTLDTYLTLDISIIYCYYYYLLLLLLFIAIISITFLSLGLNLMPADRSP